MSRITRYQAAIVLNEKILLIKNHELLTGHRYWLLPGGGREPGESEIECVQREVQEETNLEVKVLRVLLEEKKQHPDHGTYQQFKTFLCHPLTTSASPGSEPEPEVAAAYRIIAVGWFNLYDETSWDDLILNDPITAPILRRIRIALEAARPD